MAATKAQGKVFTLFMGGLTAATAGIAFFTSGSGKASLAVGRRCPCHLSLSLPADQARRGQSRTRRAASRNEAHWGGTRTWRWLVVLVGLHMTASVPGRMVTTLIGFAVTLVGVLYVLPAAASKNAIWKA